MYTYIITISKCDESTLIISTFDPYYALVNNFIIIDFKNKKNQRSLQFTCMDQTKGLDGAMRPKMKITTNNSNI